MTDKIREKRKEIRKEQVRLAQLKLEERTAQPLGCMLACIIIVFCLSAVVLTIKVEARQEGYDKAKQELIQDVEASEAVPVQPEPQIASGVSTSTSAEEWARIETVLQRYQSPINTIHLAWTEEHYNCDPSLLVAIMVADTRLGTDGYGARTYNPGNISNTEHSFSAGFPGWQEGVNAICETLNNQYLGGVNLLGELSGGGRLALGLSNCNGNKCYATSAKNWHVNVCAIMSELKGYPVGADYQFRRV